MSIRLEQVYELLKRPEVQHLIPDPPPPAPAMFFGREALFSRVKEAILRDEDVALIGPGGIGKSCVAKAVINDADIKNRYRRRFFITYDGVDHATITFDSFTQRIASALGLQVSGAETERQIRLNLESSPVLLILDNAETFEDAVDQNEVNQIASFVSLIANLPGITVILTSRTRNNARTVRWTQFIVPPLDKIPARQYFQTIYHGELKDDEIDGLLGELDFHPLSIHILAYTAEESQWTGQELLDEWHTQRSKLLQTGYGKENLGFTLRLSLSSPSIKALGEAALDVLRVIAFFPLGINRTLLTRLFPSIPNVSSVVTTLSKVSLIYRAGQFWTMLAPIRLFLLDPFPIAGLEPLEDIRCMYYGSLWEISEERDSHADLFVSDHVNIEHLIAFDITHPSNDLQDATEVCRRFLSGLEYHKLHPTSLGSIIPVLPEESPTEKDSKAWCLDILGCHYSELSNYSCAATAYFTAYTLFLALGNHVMAMSCIFNAAMANHNLGRFSQAGQLLDGFIHSTSWKHIDEEDRAEVYFLMDLLQLCTSSERTDTLFVRFTEHPSRDLESRLKHWEARMLYGHTTPAEVQQHLEPLRSRCMQSPNVWDRWFFFEVVAMAAFLQGKHGFMMQVLDEAHQAVNDNLTLTLTVLTHKAAVASELGSHERARSLLGYCLDTLGAVATPSSSAFLTMLYIQGRNELYAGNYSTAHRLLADVVAHCDASGEIGFKTTCTRALGEVETQQDHELESNRYFAQTVELCREAGVPPELLDITIPALKVDDDRFPGWKRYLLARSEAG